MENSQESGWSWTDVWLPAMLLSLAGAGWWWSVISADRMRGDAMPMGDQMSMGAQYTMPFAAFLVAWVAMMAAMMLPGILPLVRRYAGAAAGSAASPVIFVVGYLAVWTAVGIPAFIASTHLNPVLHTWPWVGHVAGAAAVVAGLHQLTPLKATCLRHSRWPATLSAGPGGQINGPAGSFVAGGRYGINCVGSCWLLMVVLIAFGTMQLAWMLGVAVVIWLEKVTPFGDQLRRVTAAALLVLGVALLVHPAFVSHLV